MAIEGNDWYYLGGAAIGGAFLGALGQRLFEPKPEAGQVLVIGREYIRVLGEKTRVEVNIIADFDKGGYTTELEQIEDPDESHTFPEVFKTPEQAAEFLEEFMDKTGFKPETGWMTYLEINLEGDEEIPSRPPGSRISGKKQRK